MSLKRLFTRQEEGTAGPSLAASLIVALPERGEKLLFEETTIARNVAAVAFAGRSSIPNLTIFLLTTEY